MLQLEGVCRVDGYSSDAAAREAAARKSLACAREDRCYYWMTIAGKEVTPIPAYPLHTITISASRLWSGPKNYLY